jgi:hypothetical protein
MSKNELISRIYSACMVLTNDHLTDMLLAVAYEMEGEE